MSRAFTGTEYLEHDAAVLTAVPITLGAFFTINSLVGADQTLIGLGASGLTTQHFRLQLSATSNPTYPNAPVAVSRTTSSAVAIPTLGPTATGTWYSAMAVFASSTSRTAYFNGANDGSNTTSNIPSGINKLRIGSSMTDKFHNGLIAQAAVWNVALDATQAALYASGVPAPLIAPENLVAYWGRLGDASPEVDLIGAYDLTVSNAASNASNPTMLGSTVSPWFEGKPIGVLPSITGKTAWVDYIPVKFITSTSVGRYDNAGAIDVSRLVDVGNSANVAWIDYIPVWPDTSKTTPWSTDAGGYIPLSYV